MFTVAVVAVSKLLSEIAIDTIDSSLRLKWFCKGRHHNKKTGKFQYNVPNRLGGIKNKTNMSEIQIVTFENPCMVLIFQKCMKYKLLSDHILKKKN